MFRKALLHLLPLAATAFSVHAAVSVPGGGTTVDFATTPSGADFASVNVTGGTADTSNVAGLDSNVAANLAWPATATDWGAAANSINIQPAVSNLNAQVRYVVDTQRLLTGPTGNRYHALIGRFTNSAAAGIESFSLNWAEGIAVAPTGTGAVGTDPLAGISVYFSKTGTAGSWQKVDGPHGAAGVVGPSIITPATPIAPGSGFYIAWVDDNGPGSTGAPNFEGNYTIDDITISNVNLSTGSISGAVSAVTRNAGVSALDPSDDTLSYTLTVSGQGIDGTTWTIAGPPAFAANGTMGTPLTATVPISEFNAAPHAVTLTVSDPTSGATVDVVVTAPWTTLSATAGNFVRLPGADPVSRADDTFTYDLTVTGQYVSGGWTLLAPSGPPGIQSAGFYGVPVPSGEMLIPALVDGTSGPLAQTGNFNLFDNVIAEATPPNYYLLPPLLIGSSSVPGTSPDVLSDGRLLLGATEQITYSNNPDLRLLQMTDGDAGGAGIAPKLITSTMDLAGAEGAVRFSMRLTATDGSSGFEASDTFAAQLVLNDGTTSTTVNLVQPSHESVATRNGILAGTELAAFEETNVFTFDHIIPDNIISARLEIRSLCDSAFASERMLIDQIVYEPALPGLLASGPSNVVRIENGNGIDDDTMSFTTTITGVNAGPGWTCTFPGATPASGAYGTVTITIPVPQHASGAVVNFTDATVPGSAAQVLVPIPHRAIIARRNFGNGQVAVATSLSTASSALWVFDGVELAHQIYNGVTGQTETLLSEVLDISAVGAVHFTGKLVAVDDSTGSNFETGDKLKAELILDGGLPTESVIPLSAPYDTGNGRSAVPFVEGAPVPNGAPDGWINGYAGTETPLDGFPTGATEYDAHRVRDEFNRPGQAASEFMNVEFLLDAVIPASANTVQIRIQSQGIQGTERASFLDALFDLSVPIVPGNVSMAVNVGSSGKISMASLAAAATGGSGAVTFSALHLGTPGGASVTLQDGWLVYEPRAGFEGLDTFSYSLTDGFQVVHATVTVLVHVPNGGTLNIFSTEVEGEGRRLGGMGIPGRLYQWQYSADLGGWVALGPPAACAANGVMSTLDPGPLPSRRYYRLVEVVAP